MFTTSQTDCIAKFNPGVGTAQGDVFHTQFEACEYEPRCNRQSWLAVHPEDTSLKKHQEEHASRNFFGKSMNNGAFIMHNTTINLSVAEKYQLS